jgi:hypothetical protein
MSCVAHSAAADRDYDRDHDLDCDCDNCDHDLDNLDCGHDRDCNQSSPNRWAVRKSTKRSLPRGCF